MEHIDCRGGVAACLAVEEGGAPVGVADPRQDGVLGLLQELHAHGFEKIAVIDPALNF